MVDPISLSITALSVGAQLFGTYEKSQGAAAQLQTQQQEIGVEQQENALRQQMMNLSSKREQMQVLRNVQRARSLVLSNAASSGAQFGSALGGGFGQIAGAGNTNALKIAQDTEAGNQMFGFQNTMLGLKQQYAAEGGQINFGSGIMDIGKMLGQNNTQLTSLIKNFS